MLGHGVSAIFRRSPLPLTVFPNRRFVHKHMSEADYDSWTKEELISRLVQLESHGSSKPSSKGKGRAQAESIDWANAPRRKIALKFCYGGWDYGGLAIQKDRTPLPTVEGKLFGALVRARLVDPKGGLEGCGWERCGRTDRGVSAAGQVISLWVRSALSQEELTPASTPTEEHPFTYMINRHLPDTIKILAWSPVDASFSSRYSCTWRHYKYFFSPVGLDIAAMRAACAYLPGTHDFRNLCKIDPTKQLDQFRRDILHASISPVDASNPGGMHVFDLKGSSFLYHMVRNIMGVLLSIGARLEPPTLLPALMNVAPGCRPEYMMADALPLTLWDCGYPEGAVNWQPETRDPHSMVRVLPGPQLRAVVPLEHSAPTTTSGDEAATPAVIVEDAAPSAPRNVFIPLGGGTHRKMMSAKYVPVLQRNRLEHFEVQNARWREKARQKGLKIPDHAPEDAEEYTTKAG
ncbi:pseudouridine synthase [Schizophyllum commune Loenen D]|nr:pseudouridine synthase [Schizophyllum commune Loenen D]